MSRVTGSREVLATPWFRLVAKEVPALGADAYYALEIQDYVTVLARAVDGRYLAIRQFRPAVEAFTLELPSGCVDRGETPEAAARRELLEETGYEAGSLEVLGSLHTDTGRLSNRLWCFWTPDARPAGRAVEAGIEPLKLSKEELLAAFRRGEINALNAAVLAVALLAEKVA